jgi:hypothetical protein
MNHIAGQANAAFMPLGEALMYAERCRGEGRLMEAETVCRRVLEGRKRLPILRRPFRRSRPARRPPMRAAT